MHAPFAADSVHGHDVRVMQHRGCTGLVLEPSQVPLIEHGSKRQYLQSDAARERHLFGLIDDAHASPSDLAQQAKIAQRSFRGQFLSRFRSRRQRLIRHGMPNELQTVEARAQVRRQLGMLGQQLLAVRGRPFPQATQVIIDDGDQP